MDMLTINIKRNRKCAFCKYWYDPTNSAIEPVTPQYGVWKYNKNMKSKCLKRSGDWSAFASCKYYECKL